MSQPEPDAAPPAEMTAPLDGSERGGPTGEGGGGGEGARRSTTDDLLALSALDDHVDELRAARAALAERAELASIERAAAELERRSRALQAQRDERSEHEASLARSSGELSARIAHIEAQARSGTVSFRDQEALSTELASLSRQRDALEDEELSDLTALDELEHESERLESERPVLIERFRRATTALQAAERTLDEQIAGELARRPPLLEAVGAALGREYESLRARLGSTPVARVSHGMCSGCHLTLPATEADRLRHAGPGTTARCEQCGRILLP